MNLLPQDRIIGIFRGFSEGRLEFHADVVLRYRADLQSSPIHGQFVLVHLDEDEAALGRITSVSSDGRLASSAGEDYLIRVVAGANTIPEELREQYLKYRVGIRMLGVVRACGDELAFAASHRRLPHVGSPVGLLSDALLTELAGHNIEGAELGFLAMGEFVYSGADDRAGRQPWMQIREPSVVPRFDTSSLVARRSFVFARAGFGKSNLVKLLFSNLYRETPTVEKRKGRQVPVGTIIFDPDGEYYWPDDKSRPGLCDVPHLEDKLVVFTDKIGPSPFYQSFVAGGTKLDIRRLSPGEVIATALSPDRQSHQNVEKLRRLSPQEWSRLVDVIHRDGNAADPEPLRELLRLGSGGDAELHAARSNMTTLVKMLHDPASQTLDVLLAALRAGKICVYDVSRMRGPSALVLSGLLLQRVFNNNQEEFTKAEPQTIPTIAVLEEAQSVLGSREATDGPYVSWVKEGRKYDLGAVLITQQPGSISTEILSQGDNWFVFHLLAAADLVALKRANAHFSDDLLSSLLNEPIPGQGVYWSSVSGRSFPIPFRALSFEAAFAAADPHYNGRGAPTFAADLRARFDRQLEDAQTYLHPVGDPSVRNSEPEDDEAIDALETYLASAIEHLRHDSSWHASICDRGVPWRGAMEKLKEHLPENLSDRHEIAFQNVRRLFDDLFGQSGWSTEKRPRSIGAGETTWIVVHNAGAGEARRPDNAPNGGGSGSNGTEAGRVETLDYDPDTAEIPF